MALDRSLSFLSIQSSNSSLKGSGHQNVQLISISPLFPIRCFDSGHFLLEDFSDVVGAAESWVFVDKEAVEALDLLFGPLERDTEFLHVFGELALGHTRSITPWLSVLVEN